jgi:hypothetical protein
MLNVDGLSRFEIKKLKWEWEFRTLAAPKILHTAIINGDDICFRSTERLFKLFEEAGNELGFEKSIGKCYLSEEYCTINSQNFELVRSKTSQRYKVTRCGFINFHVLHGTESYNTPLNSANGFVKISKHCPEFRDTLHACFGRYKKYAMPNRCSKKNGSFHGFTPNWFIPRALGGLGVPMEYCLTDPKITRPQRLVAAHFYLDPKNALFRSSIKTGKPLNLGFEVPLQKSRWIIPNEEEETPLEWNHPEDSSWQERILYATHLSNSLPTDKEGETLLVRQIKRCYALKPMTLDKVMALSTKGCIQYGPPLGCPPLVSMAAHLRKLESEGMASPP